MRKLLGPLLSILLLAGVGGAIWMSASEQMASWNALEIRGLVGSEKLDFFRDQRVIDALADSGLVVKVEKAGSRQIATSYDLKQYDFAFPAGAPAAEKIRREHQALKSFDAFYTPMAIASWRPIAEMLIANGIVEQREGAYYIVDMKALLDAIIHEKRWTDLKESQRYPANKSIMVTTTDVRKSNSSAMYLALASYILNGGNMVENEGQSEAIIDALASLFLRQGFVENSSAIPFQDYLVMGPGKSPLVMIYEAQYLFEAAQPDGALLDDMVLLYPEPTLFTKHILIPFSDGGAKLGEALTSNPELRRLAVEYGLRTDDVKAFRAFVETNNLAIPTNLVNVIEPPSYETLEGMIQMIEAIYRGDQPGVGN